MSAANPNNAELLATEGIANHTDIAGHTRVFRGEVDIAIGIGIATEITDIAVNAVLVGGAISTSNCNT